MSYISVILLLQCRNKKCKIKVKDRTIEEIIQDDMEKIIKVIHETIKKLEIDYIVNPE